jgi:hypothetical protein
LVDVLRMGWLEDSYYFHVDIEHLGFDLECLIYEDDPNIRVQRNIWAIMTHIASGVEFVHSHGIALTNIVPENGTVSY